MRFVKIIKNGVNEKTKKPSCRYRKGQVVSIPDTAKGRAMEKALIETLKVGKVYTNTEAKSLVSEKREKREESRQKSNAVDTAKTDELAKVMAKAMAEAMATLTAKAAGKDTANKQ